MIILIIIILIVIFVCDIFKLNRTKNIVSGGNKMNGQSTDISTKIVYPRTYVMFGATGLDHEVMHDLLSKKGWRQDPLDVNYASFVWVELEKNVKFDKRSYTIKCLLKNITDENKIITDKKQLHLTMQKKFPEISQEHIANTRNLSDVDKIQPDEVLIIRPSGSGSFGGRNILRVSTNYELKKAKEMLLHKYFSVIASTYIRNPLLFEGKKMHIRMYWLVIAEVLPWIKFKSLLWERGKIFTASKPYIDKNFKDRNIHDTHADSTPRNLYFPQDLLIKQEIIDNILKQMHNILDHMAVLLQPLVKPFEESKFAYEVFGCDFMVTDLYTVILLEVNDRVGFKNMDKNVNQNYKEFTKDYYNWIYQNAIEPIFNNIDA